MSDGLLDGSHGCPNGKLGRCGRGISIKSLHEHESTGCRTAVRLTTDATPFCARPDRFLRNSRGHRAGDPRLVIVTRSTPSTAMSLAHLTARV